MKKEVIAQKNPKSPISEIFRTLRTNIQFMDINKKMKTLLVTSTFAGEGKSWTTSNLAVTFAQAGKKVILVDADMRKGREYQIFDVAPKPGLSNYLSQAEITDDGRSTESLEKYIQETEVENLYMITAGSVPPNPSELLVSAQMINLIEQLKALCDIVIFDGTPCELVADSIILSRLVDSTIIVTSYKSTKKESLDRIIKNIKNVGGKIAGVVLNKVPAGNREYEYYGAHTSNKMATKKTVVKKIDEFNERVNANILELNKELENNNNIVNNEANNVQPNEGNNNTENTQIQNNAGENVQNTEFLDKTNEILKQINDYIDNEKLK